MNNRTTSVGRPSTARRTDAGNRQSEVFTLNYTNSREVDNVIDKLEKSPLSSTYWYISFFFSQSS